MFNLFKKIKSVINKRYLRTPGVEYLIKNMDNEKIKRDHINFWLNCSRKNKNFKKIFFTQNEKADDELSFDIKNQELELNDEMLNSLAYNGLIIFKNILPNDERDEIIEYFNELKINRSIKKKWEKGPIVTNAFNAAHEMFGLTSIKNFKTLDSISKKFSKEIYGKIVEPTVEFRYLKMGEKFESEKTKGNTFIHTDRFLPHFKIFYTPFEITEYDAPLQYLLSSHKINDQYIKFFTNTKTFDETDEMFKKFKFKKKIVLVPSNSLYVAFTNGFHKRSQFKAKTERSMVFLQYVENFNKIDYLIS